MLKDGDSAFEVFFYIKGEIGTHFRKRDDEVTVSTQLDARLVESFFHNMGLEQSAPVDIWFRLLHSGEPSGAFFLNGRGNPIVSIHLPISVWPLLKKGTPQSPVGISATIKKVDMEEAQLSIDLKEFSLLPSIPLSEIENVFLRYRARQE